MLECKDIQLNLAGKSVIKNVSLSLNAGQLTSLIGPNGAGKSSLIKIIAGDQRPTSGQYNINGLDIGSVPIQDKAQFMAYLPQQSQLNFPFSVREVVAMGRMPFTTGNTVDDEIVELMLDKFDLKAKSQDLYLSLSGGEKQRVQIARVFAQIWPTDDKPRLLLMDEPLASLDVKYRQILIAQLRDLVQKKVAVLMVVHEFTQVSEFSDRIILLKDGVLVANDSVERVMSDELFSQTFDTPMEIIRHPESGHLMPIPK